MKTIIQVPTPDLGKSKDFYGRLGFKEITDGDQVLFTDGKFIVEINSDRHVRAGLKLFSEDWTVAAEKLREFTTVHETEDGFLSADPNGVRAYMINGSFEHKADDESYGITGNFSGASIEAVATDETARFWEAVGFEKSQGDLSQGWAVYANGGDIDVSIMKPNMCPHLFFNPSLTFFNSGNNLANIAKLREAGILMTEEITSFNKEGIADNVIINDPGGLGFFVFND